MTLETLEPRMMLSVSVNEMSPSGIIADEDAVVADQGLVAFADSYEKGYSGIPAISGDGVLIDLYNGVGGGRTPLPSHIDSLTPSGATQSPYIDFPSPGATINVGSSFNTFFHNTTIPPEQVQGLSARNFILDHNFFLKVTDDLDLSPATPEIDLSLGIGSDDGYYLVVDDTLIGSRGDRAFGYTWHNIAFAEPGLYPVRLLFAANSSGYSGLEFSWQTATSNGAKIVPQSSLYTTALQAQQLITFEEIAIGTVPNLEYQDIGVTFDIQGGDIQVTDAHPSTFVPVTSSHVLADPNIDPAQSGVVEMNFMVPGTSQAGMTDFVSFYLLDAENTSSIRVEAFDPDGNMLFSEGYAAGGASQELVTIKADRIGRILVELGSGATDTAAIDNFAFNLPTVAQLSPMLNAIPDISVTQNSSVVFQVIATDPNSSQALSYSLGEGSPDGATIDPLTGDFMWTPDATTAPGEYPISIVVADNSTYQLTDEQTFVVTVSEVVSATSATPFGVVLNQDISSIAITVNGSIASLPANETTNYELLNLGADYQLGGGDDQSIPITPSYTVGADQVGLFVTGTNAFNFEQWTEYDYESGVSGDWRIEEGGISVKQYGDGYPTSYVSDFDLVDSTFVARIKVETTDDNDFIGVVFNFQATEEGVPEDFYLLSWKQDAESGPFGMYPAERGFKLLKVTNSSLYSPVVIDTVSWDGEDYENMSVLARDESVGWEDNVEYDFSVTVQSNGQIDIEVTRVSDQELIWSCNYTDPDPLTPGKVGFFNHGQAAVRYSSPQQADFLPEGAFQLTAFCDDTHLVDTTGAAVDGDGDSLPGGNFVSTLIIDHTAPTVSATDIDVAGVTVEFYDRVGMNLATVGDVANYILLASGGDGTFDDGNEIEVAIASVDVSVADTATTTLVRTVSPIGDGIYRLIISGVQDEAGHDLNGGDYSVDQEFVTIPAPVSTNPDGHSNAASDSVAIEVSEALEPATARDSGNYTLTHLGPDKTTGGDDDSGVPVLVDYHEGSTTIELRPAVDLSSGWDESDYFMDLGLMGDWQVSADGAVVHQAAESGASFFVSDVAWESDRFAGRISVEADATDDDAIGLVLGFEADDNGEPLSYCLLNWRAAGQEGAEPGLTLAKITGDGATDPDLWDLDDADADVEVLAAQADVLWQPGGEYDFEIIRDPVTGGFTLILSNASDGQELASVAVASGTLPEGLGQVGFYCHSQAGVTFAAEKDGGLWDDGFYQLTASDSLIDLDGYFLDGDGDGLAGGDYVTQFTIDTTIPEVLGANFGANEIYVTFNDFGGMDPASVTDPTNWQILSAGGDAAFGEGNETDVSTLIQSIVWEPEIGVATLSLADLPNETDLYELRIGEVTDLAGNITSPPSAPMQFSGEDLASGTVVWKPATGGDWSNPVNWSTGELPGEDDRVVISHGDIDITVAQSVTVRRIHSAADLQINSGTFTVLGNSEITGDLIVASGAALTATGAGAVLLASGDTTIDGASLYATDGGQLLLDNATQYVHTSTANHQDREIKATGPGSLISLTGLTEVTSGTHYNCDLRIQAFDGGHIEVQNVSTMIVPNEGDLRCRAIYVQADGVDSTINLSGLVRFEDSYGWEDSTDHDGQMSALKADNNAEITLGSLTRMGQVEVLLNGTNGLQLDTLEWTHGCRFNVSADMVFPSLWCAADLDLYVFDADVDFPEVVDMDRISIFAYNGSHVSIPKAVTYKAKQSWTHSGFWEAHGPDCVISIPNLTEIHCGTNYDCDLTIRALDGGRVEIPHVTNIDVPAEGDQRKCGVHITADGTGSVIDLSSLERFEDYCGWYDSTNHDGQMSQLKALNGAEITLGVLTHLNCVELQLDGTGTLDVSTVEWTNVCRFDISTDITFPSLWNVDHLYLYVDGAEVNFPEATNIDRIIIGVTNAGQVLIPKATSYEATTAWTYDGAWEATGVGSLISMPSLTEIHGGTYYDSDLEIRALDGGQIHLPNVATIDVPISSDQRQSGIFIRATGTGSTIDLYSLESFVDNYGWTNSTNHDGQMSVLEAADDGQVILNSSEEVLFKGVEVIAGSNGVFSGAIRLEADSILSGIGTIDGSVVAAGASFVRPGSDLGTLTVTGDYTQEAGATLEVQLGGVEQGVNSDLLAIAGTATLAGGLNVALTNSFFPADEDEFSVLTAAAREGAFSTYSGLDLGSGTELSPVYGPTSVGYAVEFSTGPHIELVDPVTEVINELNHIDVTFSEVIAPGSFTLDDINLAGPGGGIAVSSIQSIGDRSFRLAFPRQTVQGDYTLRIGPDVTDLVGNPMNQDGDGTNGEAYVDEADPGDVFIHTVSLVDQLGPSITNITPVGLISENVSTITVQFNEVISAVTLTDESIEITTPTGTLNPTLIKSIDARTFELSLPELTTDGQYVITISSVEDLYGNAMSSDYSAMFTIDKTGPSVFSMVPTGEVNNTVNVVTLTFSDDMDASTLTPEDVTLSDPIGQPIAFTLVQKSQAVFEVQFERLRGNGEYTLTVGPDVLDMAGNDMNRNAAGAFTGSFNISLPDLLAESDVPTLDLSHGDTVDVNWTLRNSGTLPVGGGQTVRFYLSQYTQLDPATDRLLLELNDQATDLAAGAERNITTNLEVPEDLSLAEGTWYLHVQVDASSAHTEADEMNNDSLLATVNLTLPSLPDLTATEVTAPATVEPGELLTVAWNVLNQGGIDVDGAWQTRIWLSSDDAIGEDQLLTAIDSSGSVPSGGAAALAQSVEVMIPNYGISGNTRFVVELITNGEGQIFEFDPANNLTMADADTVVPVRLSMALPFTAVNENASGALRCTVTRSGATDGPLIVSLASDDTDELTVPATVTIPAGHSSVVFYATPVNDSTVDDDALVTITASGDGLENVAKQILVRNVQTPVLSVATSVAELTEGAADDADHFEITITRDYVTDSDLIVDLSASQAGQISLPSYVTIPAGEASVTFESYAYDDQVPEKTESIGIAAMASGWQSGNTYLTLHDDDIPGLSVTLGTTVISEGDGTQALAGIISRDEVSNVDIRVRFSSSDTTEAYVPRDVIIPAGQDSATFYIAAIEDDFCDGTQTVTLTATIIVPSCGCGVDPYGEEVTATFDVLDNDGPTLTLNLQPQMVAEGVVGAVTASVWRNTPSDEDLIVTLASSDEGELIAPATVTIPAGSQQASITLNTVQDNVVDGDQAVLITASFDGFTSGIGQVIVTDRDLPDLVVDNIQLPASSVHTNTTFEITYRVENRGLSEAISNNADPDTGFEGSWTDRVFLSDDPYVGNDILIGNYTYTGTLANTEGVNGYQRSVSINAPFETGDYWIVVQTDLAGNVHEGLETNNAQVTATPVHVAAAYSANVETDVTVAPAGTIIELTGQALDSETASPVAYAQVNIHIKLRGYDRVVSAVCDENGNFSTTWTPLPTEAGQYTIGACHPGEDSAPVQDSFTLVGMKAEPPSRTVNIIEGSSASSLITLRNLSDVPLSGLSVELIGVADNLTVELAPISTFLAGSTTETLSFTITAEDASILNSTFTIRVSSTEAPSVDIPITTKVTALQSRLSADPSQLTAGMLRGDQTLVEFTVTNTGGRATGEIEVMLPELPWMHLVSDATIPSLAPGESVPIMLQLTPTSDMELTQYTGNLALWAEETGASRSIPYSFRATSDQTGDLAVVAIDEFYYYGEGQPCLADANVTLRDALSNAIVYQGTTNQDGQVLFEEIPEGYYRLELSADKHDRVTQTIFIDADTVNTQTVFSSRQLVEYTWTVQEVEIEDRYEIVIETEFETNVPVPVVTVEGVVDFSNVPEVGQIWQTEFKFTNHGWIAAQDVALSVPTHPFYTITPLITDIGELPAKSELVVPVVVQRIADYDTLNYRQTAWINEIHYDNVGEDVGEGFEIAGMTDTDLSGWKVAFYDGQTGQVTEIINLSGVIGYSVDGTGGVWFDKANMPNDIIGIAMLAPNGHVTEFISYEGVFQAVDGPAVGRQTTDMLVSQDDSTPVDQSLQRTGADQYGANSTWTTATYTHPVDLPALAAQSTGSSTSYGPALEVRSMKAGSTPPPTPEVSCYAYTPYEYTYKCGPEEITKTGYVPSVNVDANCEGSPVTSSGGGSGGGGGSYAAPGTSSSIATIETTVNCACIEETLFEVDLSKYFSFLESGIKGLVSKIPIISSDSIEVDVNVNGKAELCCNEEGEQSFGMSASASADVTIPVFQYGVDTSIGGSVTIPDTDISLALNGSLFAGILVTVNAGISGTYEKGCGRDGCVTAGGHVGINGTAGIKVSGSASVTAGDFDEYLRGLGLDPATASVSLDGELTVNTGANGQISYDSCGDGWSNNICFDGVYVVGNLKVVVGGQTIVDLSIDDVLDDGKRDNKYYIVPQMCLNDPEPKIACLFADNSDSAIVTSQASEQLGPDEDAILEYLLSESTSSGGVCAAVRLRLEQEVIISRDAFEATLELDNGTEVPLESVLVDVRITDLDGVDCTDLFGIHEPSLENFTSVDGTGLLQAQTTGVSQWLIVPTTEAAAEGATEYIVSGTLRYTEHGSIVEVPLSGVTITVLPQPELDLDYFWQRDVIADDPWTDEVEASVPFELAVLIQNYGAGWAENLRIESAQPQIVENEKGLLVDFNIIGSEIDGQEMQPSLNLDFGDIAPGDTTIGRWFMTSSLLGHFTEYEATFRHLDSLGDDRLSLIKDVDIHELIHTVSAYGDFEDGKSDFLVNELTDNLDLPDTLYLSDGSVMDVAEATSIAADGTVNADDYLIQLTAEMGDGWNYLRLDDPGSADYQVARVVRIDEDGRETDLPLDNCWQTAYTFIGGGLRPIEENVLHLLDYGTAASYTLYYEPRDQDGPVVTTLPIFRDVPQADPVDAIEIEFSKPIDPASFTRDDLALVRDQSGNLITDAVTVEQIDETHYRITGLATLNEEGGDYALVVYTEGIRDTFGNDGTGVWSTGWMKLDDSPAVLNVTGVSIGQRSDPVEFIDITFSEPIDLSTFSSDDVRLVQNGGSNLLTDPLQITQLTETSYRLGNLEALTTADGEYELLIDMTNVTDLDGISGQGDWWSEWTMDTAAPTVTEISSIKGDATNQPIMSIDVTFSETLDPASLSSVGLTLTLNGGSNLITPGVSLMHVEGNLYRVQGLSPITVANGDYTLTVDAAGAMDLSGNAGSGTLSFSWMMDTEAPLPATDLAIMPDSGISASDGRTNSLAFAISGTLAELGLAVEVTDLTTNTDLTVATVTGAAFTGDVVLGSSGSHQFRVRTYDAAGNYADSLLNVFIDAASPSVQQIDIPAVWGTDEGNAITVEFSEPMNLQTKINDSSIVEAVTIFSQESGPLALSANQFTYDESTCVLTLSLDNLLEDLEDGIYELQLDGSKLADLAGNPLYGGSVTFVTSEVPDFVPAHYLQTGSTNIQMDAYSVPSLADWNNDGMLDLIVGEKTATGDGMVRIYLNNGSNTTPSYTSPFFAQSTTGDITVPGEGCLGVFPRFVDWDGDAKGDLILGLADGTVQFWPNIGTAEEPLFSSPTLLQVGQPNAKSDINVGSRATLDVVDWNNDGRQDLLIGALDGRVRVFLDQAESGEPDFHEEQLLRSGPDELVVATGRASIAVVDLNDDGKKDLVLGNTNGELFFYKNIGTDASPLFGEAIPIQANAVSIDLPGSSRSRPWVGDANADGKPDIVLGGADGLVRLYQQREVEPESIVVTEGLPGETYTYMFHAQVSRMRKLPGDVNDDGRVDGSDVTILATNWQAGVNDGQKATWAMGDLNGDARVDGSDVTILAANWQKHALPGDANNDGRVDGSDVSILSGNWQVGVNDGRKASWSMGDFNRDGRVDGSDVTILAGNWQAGVTSTVVATSTPEAKPEVKPTTFVPPSNASLGVATVPQRSSLPPRRFITPPPEASDAVLTDESAWSESDFTAIAKDIASTTAKKTTAASDELFALNLDTYIDLE